MYRECFWHMAHGHQYSCFNFFLKLVLLGLQNSKKKYIADTYIHPECMPEISSKKYVVFWATQTRQISDKKNMYF
jgi:hypothetical protein